MLTVKKMCVLTMFSLSLVAVHSYAAMPESMPQSMPQSMPMDSSMGMSDNMTKMDPAKFAEHKKKMLAHIETEISDAQKMQTCVKAAMDHAAMKACVDARRASMPKSMPASMPKSMQK